MLQRTLADRTVGAVGLGCMGMSWAYGSPNNEESLKVLNRALDLGVNHWDTADVYGAGNNELLLSEVLKTRRDEVFLASKFGNVWDKAATSHQDLVASGQGWIVDGTPSYARKCIEGTLKRLGTNHLDLYYLHRVDERVPIEETVGEMARFVAEGKVKSIGISEVNANTVRRAHSTHRLAAVQNELSPWTKDSVDDVLPVCQELGIAFVAYSPLGRGFLTGEIKSFDDLEESDARRNHPRFQGENFAKNLELVEVIKGIALNHGASPAQVALAWVLQLSECSLPIPGTKRIKYLEQNCGAVELKLTPSEMVTISELSDAEGTRYTVAGMAMAKR